jgi:hypothetical protein
MALEKAYWLALQICFSADLGQLLGGRTGAALVEYWPVARQLGG